MRSAVIPPHVVIEMLSGLIADLELAGMNEGAEVAKLASDTIAAMAYCMCDPDFVRKS